MKAKRVIAGAFALALGLSASAAESWFDAKISTYTDATSWTNTAGIVGGTWDAGAAEAATLEASANRLIVDAEDSAPLGFTATAPKSIYDGATIYSTVSFNAFDSLPDIPSAKAALIAVKDGATTNIYALGVASGETTNSWVKIVQDTSVIENVSVSIALSRTSGDDYSLITYTYNDGTPVTLTALTSGDTVDGVSYSGCGEVIALTSDYNAPMGTLSVDTLTDLDVDSIVDVNDSSKTYTLSEGSVQIPTGTTVRITFTVKSGVAKAFTGKNYIDQAITTKGATYTITDRDVPGTADAEAKIGSTYYLTFKKATEAVKSGDEITLLANAVIGDETLYVTNASIDVDNQWQINMTNENAMLYYADGGNLSEAGAIITELSGKEVAYVTDHYAVKSSGTVFTIVKGDNVSSITIEDESSKSYTPDNDGNITVDPTISALYFTVTAASSVSNPQYSVSTAPSSVADEFTREGNVFTLETFDTAATITFNVTGETGSTFTLTATGISGTPQYTIGENVKNFTAGSTANTWVTEKLSAGTEFTVNYTADSSFSYPKAVWTDVSGVTGTAPNFTMGSSDASATLTVSESGVIFTLTANGITGTPTYAIGSATAVDFNSESGAWKTGIMPAESTVTVYYAPTCKVAVATWDTSLTHTDDVFTMGTADGAATLTITDAGAIDPSTPGAEAAAKSAVEQSAKKVLSAEQYTSFQANVTGIASTNLASWISGNSGVLYIDIATNSAADVAVSCDLGAAKVVADPTLTMTEMASGSSSGTFTIKVALTSGDAEDAIAYAVAKVKELFEATAALGTSASWSNDNVTATPVDGTDPDRSFTVVPSFSGVSTSSAFIRVNTEANK